jgi:hypothetical protein
VDITAKGRVLLGEAQFTPLSPEDRTLQQELETRGRTELVRVANTFVNGIDAAHHGEGWEVRAEVVSVRPLQPAEVGRVERALAAVAVTPVTFSVLNPDGLIVRRDGYTTVQRVVEEQTSRNIRNSSGVTPEWHLRNG